MSRTVDVLAVLNRVSEALHEAAIEAGAHGSMHSLLLDEARAAVAELIEAISAFKGKRGAFMALGAQDKRTLRLWAALARLRGEA